MSAADVQPCAHDGSRRCHAYYAGHNTHWIHAKHIGRTPWGWRDAVVRAVDGLEITVAYVDGDHEVWLWHHQNLAGELAVGDPVRLHEQYYVLGGPFGWLNVVVRGGLGQVPVPGDLRAWQGRMTGGVQDLATGRALPLDGVSSEGR